MRKGKYVAIVQQGELNIHMAHQNQNYATLCGMDGDDPDGAVDQRIVSISAGARIDCDDCRKIWEVAQRYKASDFVQPTGGQG